MTYPYIEHVITSSGSMTLPNNGGLFDNTTFPNLGYSKYFECMPFYQRFEEPYVF